MSSSAGSEPGPPGSQVSERWARWRRQVELSTYEARWEQMDATGQAIHGEADLIQSLGPGPVLDAGCGTGRVARELARRGLDVVGVDLDEDMLAVARAKAPELTWVVADLATMRLGRRFPLIAMAGNVVLFARPSDLPPIVQTLASHLEPGGLLVAGFSIERDGPTAVGFDALCSVSGLERVALWSSWDREPFVEPADYQVSVHRRGDVGAPPI